MAIRIAQCSIDGCTKNSRTKGMCSAHYERIRVHGTLDLKCYAENLSGKRFGKLIVTEMAPKEKAKSVRWLCLCDCGETTVVQAGNLKSSHTTSCGCAHERKGKVTHGMTGTATYVSWVAMRRRCSDENYIDWNLYGGRGVKVCERWLSSFSNFLEDMGERPDGCTIDRINPDGDYSPENCKWSTAKEQAKNTRRNPVKGKTLAELCEEHEISMNTVSSRIRKQGLTLNEALTRPLLYKRSGNCLT